MAKTETATVIPLRVKKRTGKRAEDKWSPQVLRLGYTALPNLLLRAQGKLKITPMQFNVLAQIAEHWWNADEYPFPTKDRIATRMNKSPRQVQRYITQLEQMGLISRIFRYSGRKAQTSNAYSFDGLIKKMQALEPKFTKEAEQKRLRRKKFEAAAAG